MSMSYGQTAEKGFQWSFATIASIALHVVIIGLFIWSGMNSSNEPAAPESEETAKGEAEEEPKSSVENKTKDETKPKQREETRKKTVERPKPIERQRIAEKPVEKPRVVEKPRAPEPRTEKKTGEPTVETYVYVVRRGDMLTHIAQNCGMSVSELAKLNGMSVKKLSALKVGQRIKLPKRNPK